jgi:hypothetical protein
MQLPDVFNCTDNYWFSVGAPVRNSTHVRQDLGMLQSIGTGRQVGVAACASGLSAIGTFSMTLAEPVTVQAVLLDTRIYNDWLTVRVAAKVLDGEFNTKTNRNRVYITAVGTSATKTANCQPSAVQGTCVATITAPVSWLSDGANVQVHYGLGSSLAAQTFLGACTPLPSETASYQDNLLVNMPSRPLSSGEEFNIVIEAQAASDVESTKFTLFIEDTSALEVVGTPTGLNGNVWSYQFVIRTDGFTAVLNRKPDAAAATTHSQETQTLVQARLRVKVGTASTVSGVQLRVQELNAPTPVNPGGQLIPEGGCVAPHCFNSRTRLCALLLASFVRVRVCTCTCVCVYACVSEQTPALSMSIIAPYYSVALH